METQDMREQDLARLIGYIERNRFLPIPPSEKNFVGDGDFLAVGIEFLKWFVGLGELTPQERVLDIGCGIGRMALPLTQYLQDGTYDGVDVAAEGIDWCTQHITPCYENFRFHRLDLVHPIYNPEGAMRTEDVRLPLEDESYDFIFLTSVITHLTAPEIRAYAREIKRLLAPGGRCLVTAFMLNSPARRALVDGKGVLPFDGASPGREIYAYPDNPSAAVAFEEDYLLSLFWGAGIRRTRPPVYGRWSGRSTPGDSFQDINLLQAVIAG
jgi:SAM-dependent methyltransferase